MQHYSESFIRKVIREKNPWVRGCEFYFWDYLDEKKQKKLLKATWAPVGVRPLLTCTSTFLKYSFIMGKNNVLYGSKDMRFSDGRRQVSILDGYALDYYMKQMKK